MLFSAIITIGARDGGKGGSTSFVKVEIGVSINRYFSQFTNQIL